MKEEQISPGLLFAQGLLAVIFGLIVVAWPGVTLATLVFMMGLFLLIDGIMAVGIGFFSIGKEKHWYLTVLLGLLAIAAGVVVFQYTKTTFAVLATIFGIFTVASGIVNIVTSLRFKKEVQHRFLLMVAGVVNLLFGILLIAHPFVTSVAYVWIIGVTAIFTGMFAMIASIKLRHDAKKGK